MPLITKLLVDVGRQFLWSPLSVSNKREDHTQVSSQLSSTFYSTGAELCQNSSFRLSESDGDRTQFDSHCVNVCSNENTLVLQPLKTHVSGNVNCDSDNVITLEIKFTVTVGPLRRSLSAPNLSRDCDSPAIIVNTDICEHIIHDTRNEFLDPLYKLREIDSDNGKSCAKVSDLSEDKVVTSELTSQFPIDNNATIDAFASFGKSDSDGRGIKEFGAYRKPTTIATNGLCRSIYNTLLEYQTQEKLRNKMDSVPLHDFFEDNCHDNSQQSSPLLQRIDTFGNRNSRRNIRDKRIRNTVIDRLKRIARSQSQGRSDGVTSSTNSNSRAIVMRTKGLYRHVKRRFSSPPQHYADEEMGTVNDDPCNAMTSLDNDSINNDAMTLQSNTGDANVLLRHYSSLESFQSVEDSGCGSSIQTNSLSTDSNRSSICNGDDVNNMNAYYGPFISCARAINDFTPCPYDRDALSFKKGDIISIIAKNDSGTWIGMANGKIGHFKFINVEEIKCFGKSNKMFVKTDPIVELTHETEIETKCFNESHCDTSIYEALKSRLNESIGSLTLSDVLHTLGLHERGYLSIFELNGFKSLDAFKEMGQSNTLNALGITNLEDQQILLNAAAIITEKLNDHHPKPTFLNFSSHRYLRNHTEFSVQSAPSTPAVEFFHDLSDMISKFNISSLSEDNEIECPDVCTDVCTDNYHNGNSQSCVKFNDTAELTKCENIEVSKRTASSVCKENKFDPFCDGIYQNWDSMNNVNMTRENQSHNETNNIHDTIVANKDNCCKEPMDRKLLRKLDITPIYNPNKGGNSAKGIVTSQSVLDLRANACNNIYKSTSKIFGRKKRNKKQVHCSRKSCSTLITSNDNVHSLNETSKCISQSLIDAIHKQLKSEKIDLTYEPYSDSAGFCGIPPALVQRYAEESQRDVYDIADALDHIRMQQLHQLNRRGVPNDYLGDSCNGPATDSANYENLHLWLMSIGLPMYESGFHRAECNDLYRVSKLRESDLINRCGIHERRHLRTLTNAIGALHLNLKGMNCN